MNKKGGQFGKNLKYICAGFFLPLLILFLIGFTGIVNVESEKKRQDSPVKYSDFDLGDVKLLPSPFKHAMQMDGKYLLSLNVDRLLAPYYIEAGLEPKAPLYGGWEDSELKGHTLGHYLSAISMMYAATGDQEFGERADYIVSELAHCQKAAGDGYIGGIPDRHILFDSLKAGKLKETANFSLNDVWSPWYNLHKAYQGLLDAYLHTDNEEAKDVLVKYSDWAVDFASHLNDEQFQKMLETEFGGMNEVLADVYAITGEEKYLTLAQRFYHKAVLDPLADGEDNLEGLHSNTQVPKIIGVARQYELTQEERLAKIAKFFWNQVALKRSYVIGGNSNHEYFGELGQLSERLSRATAETCNTYNMLKLTKHLMQWDPKVKYADFYERALYNHILASQDPETGMVTYLMSLEPGGFKTFSHPFDSFWCCVGSGMENHVKYGTNIYLHNDTELLVNLFIPSELTWKEKGLTLRQETEFPNSEETTVTLNLEKSREFSLKIRKPSWVEEEFALQVNGRTARISGSENGYVSINRTWKDGDKVVIELPMEVRLEYMPNSDTKAALLYGPVVLAGELGNKWFFDPMPIASSRTEYFDVPLADVPKLETGDRPVTEWVQKIPDESLQFRTTGVGKPNDVTLSPFYKIHRQHYTVYWDINPDETGKTR